MEIKSGASNSIAIAAPECGFRFILSSEMVGLRIFIHSYPSGGFRMTQKFIRIPIFSILESYSVPGDSMTTRVHIFFAFR